MDEALKKKVMIGAFAALLGLVVYLNWPEGEASAPEWFEDAPAAKRVKKELPPEVETVERRKQDVEVEEEAATKRRKRAEVDAPIRRGSKKPTAKSTFAPAA